MSAAQLSSYPALLSLSDNLCAPLPLMDSLLTGLSALSRLQHLALSQCAGPLLHTAFGTAAMCERVDLCMHMPVAIL